MLRLFKPTPLSFRERRDIIKRKWERYGYMNRPQPSRQMLDIAERVNSLMIAFN